MTNMSFYRRHILSWLVSFPLSNGGNGQQLTDLSVGYMLHILYNHSLQNLDSQYVHNIHKFHNVLQDYLLAFSGTHCKIFF